MQEAAIQTGAAMKYRPEIDGLRALAVGAVVIDHAGFETLSGGFLGVDIFFVISGYLISSILMREIDAGSFSFRAFYLRRARRLAPALFVMLALATAAAALLFPPPPFAHHGSALIAIAAFVSNYYYYSEIDYFATAASLDPLVHTWSLAVEEQFYLLFPLLMVWCASSATARRVWPGAARTRALWMAAGLALLSLAAAEVTLAWDPELAYYALHTRAWQLLLGAVAALAAERWADQLARLPRVAGEALAAAGLAACVWALFAFTEETSHPGVISLIPTAGAAAALVFATRGTLTGRALALPPFVAIGLISYSLYLYHQPVFAFWRLATDETLGPLDMGPPALACLALATLSWRFVERPFRDRARISDRPMARTAVAMALLPVLLGGAIISDRGAPWRLEPTTLASIRDIARSRRDRNVQPHRRANCFYRRKSMQIDAFLEAWDCLGTGPAPVLVVGDSHASDKAWSLLLAGEPVGLLAGQGCRLSPTRARPDCAALMRRARDVARSGAVSGVVLVNRWGLTEARPKNVRAMAEFWADLPTPVLVFSPTPEFPRLRERIMARSLFGRDYYAIPADRALSETTTAATGDLAARLGAPLLDSTELFCGGPITVCAPFDPEGRTLLIDYGHYARRGAERVATALAADPTWRAWIAALEPPTAPELGAREIGAQAR